MKPASPAIIARPLPETALLVRYRDLGAYVDCLTADLPGQVTLAQFVLAFYTSPAFRPERVLLGLVIAKHASNADAARLAEAQVDRFSAWTTEAREDHQLLLCDYQSRTRSWLMVSPLGDGGGGTRLHFGSAVTEPDKTPTRRLLARLVWRALMCFHKVYARVLLRSAVRRVMRGTAG